MRQIEKNMLNAVRDGKSFRSGNTVVTADNTGIKVYLHGNCIFAVYQGVKRSTLAGWNTVTTRPLVLRYHKRTGRPCTKVV